MDHNSYPLRKLGYDSRDYGRERSNSCGSYVKYFLLSTSIIQLLIIMGLVLFMTYGNNHSSQQSRLESTQNQSVKLINDINNLHGLVRGLRRDLRIGQYRNGNLSTQLEKINKMLHNCNNQKNALLNITDVRKILRSFPCIEGPNLNRGLDVTRSYDILQANHSMLQKKLADIAAENELKQAKHVLEETKLNSQKRELLKQVEDLRGNCTSLSRDFQKMMGAARTNYEASFRRLTERIGGYDQNLNRQLEQIMVNCTPLSSNFQREVQREVDRFDAMIKGMWHQNNEQSSRIGILEKMNEECEQKAAAQSDQFRKRESSLQEDVEKYLTEKVQLLEERNKLRRQLTATNTRNGQTDSFLNPGSDRISSVSCFSEREELVNAQIKHLHLAEEKKTLEENKTKLEQEAEKLRQQLKEETGNCSILQEKQKALGCRQSGFIG